MKYSIAGTVHHVGETETIGANGFIKRVFVLQTEAGKWPKYLAVELHKDATENAPEIGQAVQVDFYLESREGKGRWFTAAKCAGWKADGAAPVPRGKPANKPPTPPANPAAALGLDDAEGDLPF